MTIDERIVQLGLNNNSFEKHAQESMKTLDKLEKSLNITGEFGGFEKIEGLLEKITNRFSVMGIAGDQVVRRLTDSVMKLVGQMGNLAKSMSFEQINAGFLKYGDKTQSVQTIMAATAKDWTDTEAQMEWVNGQLQKLNWFTDETSYNFVDMVNNIGKFTSNGIKLETAVTAMEGISTWAAISGANANEASRAMYNLSQALAVGSVKLMDWKSIENANMATREFKEIALETAVSLGTLTKTAEGTFKTLKGHTFTTEQFNTQLSDEWFSKDVLMSTLESYGRFSDILNEAAEATGRTASELIREIDVYKKTGKAAEDLAPYIKDLASSENDLGFRAFKAAQEAKTFKDAIDATKDAVSTGWMNIFELLFGNYMQAKELWTNLAETLYDVFAGPVKRLEEILRYAFGGISGPTEEAAGTLKKASGDTSKFQGKLEKLGKTMEDFEKSVKAVSDRETLDMLENYGSIEDALKGGAINAELFDKALVHLFDKDLEGRALGLNTALVKNGKTMKDFEKAIYSVSDRATIDLIENYGSVEDAFKKGAISADLFKKALELLGIDSSTVSQEVSHDAEASAASLEKYREVAMAVLRGDYGNGEERRKAIEELGLDYELIQAMAGNLKNAGYNISDEALMTMMEQYYSFNGLSDRIGFGSFAEYIGGAVDDLYTVDELMKETHEILTDIYGQGVVGEDGQLLNGGELFREGLNNLMTFLDDIATAFDTAFLKIFGGSEEAEEAVKSLGDRFWAAAAKFHEFTEAIQLATRDENGEIIDSSKLDSVTDLFANLLSVIKLLGQALGVVFRTAKSGIKIVLSVMKKIIPIIASAIHGITQFIEELNNGLEKNSAFKNFISTFQNIYEAIKAPIDVIFEFVSSLIKVQTSSSKITKSADSLAKKITELSARMAVATYKFKEFMTSSETLEKVRHLLINIAKAVSWVKSVISGAADLVKGILPTIISAIQGVIYKISELWDSIKQSGEEESTFTRIWNSIATAVDWVTEKLGQFKEAILGALGGDGGVGITKILTNLLGVFLGFKAIKGIGGLFGKIGDAIGGIGSIGEFLSNPASIFTNFFDGIKEAFGFGNDRKSFADDLKSIAISIGILAASLMLLAGIDQDKLAGAMGHMTTVMVEMVGVLAMIKELGPGKEVSKAAVTLIEIAAAMLIMSLALSVLGKIDPDRLTGAWEAMSLSLLSMIAALTLISEMKNLSGKKLLAAGAAMIGIAMAMLILTASLAVLSLIDPGKLGNAIFAMIISITAISLALGMLAGNKNINSGKMLAVGAALMGVAAAILIISLALIALSFVDPAKLANSLLTMAVALGAMILTLYLLGNVADVGSGKLLAAGAALIGVAAAMVLVAIALMALSVIKPEKLIVSLGVMVVALGIMAAVLYILAGLGPVILAAAGALLLAGVGFAIGAAGLLVLAVALQAMRGLKLAKIAGGLLVLAPALAVLGVAGIIFGLGGIGLALGGAGLLVLGFALNTFRGMRLAEIAGGLALLGLAMVPLGIGGAALGMGAIGLIAGGIALLVFSGGLKALSPGIKAMSDVSLKDILKVSAGILALGIAGVPLMFGALGLAVGGPALAEFGKSLPPLASGLQTFEAVDWSTIGKAFVILAESIGALLVLQFATLADGSIQLANLGRSLPPLAEGLISLNDVAWETIAKAFFILAEGIGSLILLEFTALADGTVQLANLGQALVPLSAGLISLDGVSWENIGKAFLVLAEGIGSLILLDFTGFGTGPIMLGQLGEALPSLASGIAAFGEIRTWDLVKTFGAVAGGITSLLGAKFAGATELSLVGEGIQKIASGLASLPENAGDKLNGLGTSISSFLQIETTTATAGIEALVNAMESAFLVKIIEFETKAEYIPAHMANGMQNNSMTLLSKGEYLMSLIQNAMSGYDGVWTVLGGNITIGIANGIIERTYEAVNAMSGLASSIQSTFEVSLAIRSPSRVMANLAKYIPLGIAKGIESEGGAVENSMITVISPMLAALAAYMEQDYDISPTITPVVDMSNVQFASASLDSMFDKTYGSYIDRITASAGNVNASIDYNLQSKEIINEVRSLSGRLDELGHAITNMQIILDTGVMVGQTSAKMDQQLGRMAARKGRGN